MREPGNNRTTAAAGATNGKPDKPSTTYMKHSMNYTDDETYRRIHFAVMAIESGARKLGISGKEMHDRLQKQGLIHRRLIRRYEELHTQSLDWVADDISETLLNWETEV